MTIRLQKVKAGHYKYGEYDLIRWQPESQNRYLWCLSIDRVGLEDFRTLAKAKEHIQNDIAKRGNQ